MPKKGRRKRKVNCNALGQNNRSPLRKFLVKTVKGTHLSTDRPWEAFNPNCSVASSTPEKRRCSDSQEALKNSPDLPGSVDFCVWEASPRTELAMYMEVGVTASINSSVQKMWTLACRCSIDVLFKGSLTESLSIYMMCDYFSIFIIRNNITFIKPRNLEVNLSL